jgi:hypothetical protein
MGGLEKHQGGTYRIELYGLTPLNYTDLVNGKVTNNI